MVTNVTVTNFPVTNFPVVNVTVANAVAASGRVFMKYDGFECRRRMNVAVANKCNRCNCNDFESDGFDFSLNNSSPCSNRRFPAQFLLKFTESAILTYRYNWNLHEVAGNFCY